MTVICDYVGEGVSLPPRETQGLVKCTDLLGGADFMNFTEICRLRSEMSLVKYVGAGDEIPVSYTHLTLPTILRV